MKKLKAYLLISALAALVPGALVSQLLDRPYIPTKDPDENLTQCQDYVESTFTEQEIDEMIKLISLAQPAESNSEAASINQMEK